MLEYQEVLARSQTQDVRTRFALNSMKIKDEDLGSGSGMKIKEVIKAKGLKTRNRIKGQDQGSG